MIYGNRSLRRDGWRATGISIRLTHTGEVGDVKIVWRWRP